MRYRLPPGWTPSSYDLHHEVHLESNCLPNANKMMAIEVYRQKLWILDQISIIASRNCRTFGNSARLLSNAREAGTAGLAHEATGKGPPKCGRDGTHTNLPAWSFFTPEQLPLPCGREQLEATLRVAAINGSNPTKSDRAAAVKVILGRDRRSRNGSTRGCMAPSVSVRLMAHYGNGRVGTMRFNHMELTFPIGQSDRGAAGRDRRLLRCDLRMGCARHGCRRAVLSSVDARPGSVHSPGRERTTDELAGLRPPRAVAGHAPGSR